VYNAFYGARQKTGKSPRFSIIDFVIKLSLIGPLINGLRSFCLWPQIARITDISLKYLRSFLGLEANGETVSPVLMLPRNVKTNPDYGCRIVLELMLHLGKKTFFVKKTFIYVLDGCTQTQQGKHIHR
jgi:hypothetical protein